MAVDESAGSVADVLDARRALAAAVKAPGWIQPLAVVGGAAAMAALTGGGLTGTGFATAVVLMLATIYLPIFVLVRHRRAMGVRLRRRRRTRRQWRIAWLVFFVFVGTAYGLTWVLPLGTPLAYTVQFLAAAAILGTYMAVNTRDPVGNDAGRLVLAEDHPGQFDQLIASRSRLRLCACLAAIEEIELRLLAHCVQQQPDAFLSDIAELARAQYVWGRHDAGRDWAALTPDGRTRYRRHLAALLAVPA
ncbi:MAG: hypothetical protein WB785_01215 [Mycobacterium sp.]|uniref:hypothetical protein n=1 Tax=Mycobacterium sp. TaxID=1785 RepID=UPI003C6B2180